MQNRNVFFRWNVCTSLSSPSSQASERRFYWKPTWKALKMYICYSNLPSSLCLFFIIWVADYSSPVIMLTCVKPKLPCSCFKKPRLEKNSPYLQPQPLMPSPDARQWPLCQQQLPKHLWNSAPLCVFVTSSLPPLPSSSLCFYLHSTSRFLACFQPAALHLCNRNLIILGGMQMVSAVRQKKDAPLSLWCCLTACSTAWKLMDVFVTVAPISIRILNRKDQNRKEWTCGPVKATCCPVTLTLFGQTDVK